MKSSSAWFNLILALALLSCSACKSTDSIEKDKKDKKKQATFLRFHLETNPDGTPYNETVPIYRSNPVMVQVEREPSLDEGYIKDAAIVDADALGGFAIKITFDDAGTRRLDLLTGANKGRRLAIAARWTETRWLAAPLITKRISNGVFIFTPDATREEAERIVNGLKNVVKKLQEPYTF